MLKKAMLSIVMAVVLLGAENLVAKEQKGNPEAEQKQVQMRRQRGCAEQLLKQKAPKQAGQSAMKGIAQKPAGFRPGPDKPAQKFDKWLDELTKAYRQNNREQMGQLLRKMNKFRQEMQKARGAFGKRRQALHQSGAGRALFRKRGGAGWGCPYRFRSEPDRWSQGFQHRGMGRWGQGLQPQRRGAGRWGRGFQGRGIRDWRHPPPAPGRGFGW